MAKIDTTLIAGFDTMTDAEKIAALTGYEFSEDHTGYIRKEQFDRTASELSTTKKALKDLQDSQLTDAQRLEQERQTFEAEKLAFNKERNASVIKGIFGSAGLKEEDYADIGINDFEDAEKAKSFANGIVKMLNNRADSAKAQERSNLIGGSAPKSGNDNSKATALQAEFETAKKNGNSLAMIRLINEAATIGIQLT